MTIFDPSYGACGDVSINGVVLPSPGDGTLQASMWDWGDGTSESSYFPGSHEYASNGVYTVTITAISQSGIMAGSTTVQVVVTSASNAGCGFDVRIYPGFVSLRDGDTSKLLHVSIRGASGEDASVDNSKVLFTSSNPDIVKVDSSGIVSATGFGQATITASVTGYPRIAAAQVFAGHLRIEPPLLVLSAAGARTGQLTIHARNADGSLFDLSSAAVGWNGSNGVAAVDSNGSVTALQPPTSSLPSPYITAQVNGVGAHNASLVRVLSRAPVTINRIAPGASSQIVFYIDDMVAGINQRQLFTDYDVALVTDLAHQIEQYASGVYPSSGDLQYLVNDVSDNETTRPCGLNGNPVLLGSNLDTNASCVVEAPAESPAWGIYFHEMGHNFTLSSQRFNAFAFSSGETSNGVYVEGLATAMAMFAGRNLLEFSVSYGLSKKVQDTLRSSHLVWLHPGSTLSLDSYIASGSQYNQMTPDILDDILSKLMETYGYTWFRRFLSVFLPVNVSFPFTIKSLSQQATFFVAAVSAATRADLKNDFRMQWGFPIDDSYYSLIYPHLLQLATHSDTPQPANSVRPERAVLPAEGTDGSLIIDTLGSCPWTAVADSPWITITSGNSGCGSGTLTFSLLPNTGSPRTGFITVAGITVQIKQCSVAGAPEAPGRSE